ncbi:alpha/beta hydrolase [Streptomyces sp. NPDC052095]|uniref:alpha/beta fold hydrolase n=1 Tax=unclassified Streptomyces TaxID=2593676 RepID=UPI00344C6304
MNHAADTATGPARDVRSQDVRAGDHRLRVYTCGEPGNPAVVLVHGSGPGVSAPSNWEHLLPVFAEAGYFAVAPDVLGFGDSAHPDPAPSGGMVAYTDLRARSLVALLDTLGIGTAHFVGNSMGGMITLRIAQIAPERLGKMILMGSGGAPLAPTADLMRLITFYDDPSPKAMAELLVRFVDDTALFAGRLDEIAADRAAKAARPGVRRSHLATFDPRHGPVAYTEEELAAITHEALVLHGREDRMLPVRAGYYLAEHLPNAQLHVLPHAGHWIQIEQAERFAEQAKLFLGEPR